MEIVSTSVSALVKAVIVAASVLLGATACTGADAPVVRDELATNASASAPNGVAWSIDWVRLDDRFTATVAVSVRADQSMLIIDDGALYRSTGDPDTWSVIEFSDARPRCLSETPAGAVVVADGGNATSRIYLEESDGTFVEVAVDANGRVGCSLGWAGDRLWGTLDDTSAFSVNVDGTDAHIVNLVGPTTAIEGGLDVLAGVEPGTIFIEGVEPAALDGAGGVWAWRQEIDGRPITLDGLMRPSGAAATSVFGQSGGALVLLGEPGVGFRTTTPLPSKAVLPLGETERWTNSTWQSPRHFVNAGDTIYGFGAFTAMGATEIDSALWSLRTQHPVVAGWSEHRGVGPRIDDAPLIVHRVAAVDNRILVAACQLNVAECDETNDSTLWLGTVTPPVYEAASS